MGYIKLRNYQNNHIHSWIAIPVGALDTQTLYQREQDTQVPNRFEIEHNVRT